MDQCKYIPQNMPASLTEAVRGSGFNQGHRPREPDIGLLYRINFLMLKNNFKSNVNPLLKR